MDIIFYNKNYSHCWRAPPSCKEGSQPWFKSPSVENLGSGLPSSMTEREDNVYLAKLAEQAERYDGM